MRASFRLASAAVLVAAAALPAAAQQPAAPATAAPAAAAPSVGADLLADVGEVEQKMMALARAIPANKFNWRPGQGARTVSEVLMHVAADNYLMPAAMGHAADPATGITTDYKTAQAYERRKLGREATLAELEKSFAHLKRTLGATPAAQFGTPVTLFGQPSTGQRAWIMTATHLHEHLGQMIAYARSNNVAPPWSRGG